MTGPSDEGTKVAAATLAALPHITARRLRRLLEHYGDPPTALRAVLAGKAAAAVRGRGDGAELARAWRLFADPDGVATRIQRRGTHVWVEGDDDFPFTRPVDTQPCVLFGEGARCDAFDRPRVGVVGTRSATPHGLADAHELGTHVGRAGATVLSGLAIGIDGAAHEGALDAGGLVIGVVATGLDVEYPRRHRALYRRVREQGVIVTEYWYGTRPDRARFPERNRIIAALSDVVAVVEATQTGGARITANYAADYGRAVFAMPGSRRNPAATGCNELLRDGALPLLQPDDVIVGLELAHGGQAQWRPPPPPAASAQAAAVLRGLAGEPATVDDLIVRTALAPADVINAVRELEQGGHVSRRRGLLWPV